MMCTEKLLLFDANTHSAHTVQEKKIFWCNIASSWTCYPGERGLKIQNTLHHDGWGIFVFLNMNQISSLIHTQTHII